nr:hypothetical protein CFP56_00023 [Quercus suber]
MGDLVLSIGSVYNKYDQDDFESNNIVSYNDPKQDSRSNATLNSNDKDSYGVHKEVDSSGVEEDSNEIQKDSNGVQKEVDSSGVEEDSNEIQKDSNGIQKDSNGDQESPRRSSRVMKNASPYLCGLPYHFTMQSPV